MSEIAVPVGRKGSRVLAGIAGLDAEPAELKRLWLLPSHRGRGLGRRLAEAPLAFAVDAGYHKV